MGGKYFLLLKDEGSFLLLTAVTFSPDVYCLAEVQVVQCCIKVKNSKLVILSIIFAATLIKRFRLIEKVLFLLR